VSTLHKGVTIPNYGSTFTRGAHTPFYRCVPVVGQDSACLRAGYLGLWRFVSQVMPVRGRQEAYSRSRRLACDTTQRPSWLRPLGCSRLSPGVVATMSRSDSSSTRSASELPCADRSFGVVRTPAGVNEVSLGHARLCSDHPGANHVQGSCAGLRLSWGGWPALSAESRSLSFRASLWLGPFTGHLTMYGCLCLLGLALHRCPDGI
jgi:hypothetical protein